MPQFLNTSDKDFEAGFQALLAAKREDSPDVDAVVADIIADVRARGDAAVLELTAKFDRLPLAASGLRFSSEEIDAYCAQVSDEDRAALELAAARIHAYHARQMPEDAFWLDEAGASLGWRWTAVSAAGLYVPGGIATYPSSVLMNAIPAKVAGVARLAMVVPTPDGAVNPLVLMAARIAGVDEIYRIGGAQAVAALAYGTETIAPVDKITGPGNAFVAAAKRRVFGKVGIDMIAGPSEILVIADRDNDPDWIALDLLSQAEHDESAQSILVTDDAAFGQAVAQAVDGNARIIASGHSAMMLLPSSLATMSIIPSMILDRHSLRSRCVVNLSDTTTENSIILSGITPLSDGKALLYVISYDADDEIISAKQVIVQLT